MSDTPIPVSESTRKKLAALARETGQPPELILDQAVEEYRRKLFFQGLAADYAALKADPAAWEEELAERKVWEGTLMDGLDPAERWTEDGRILPHDEGPK